MVALIGDRRDKTKIGLASVSAKWLQLQTSWSGKGYPGGGYSHLMRSPGCSLHCTALQREGVQVVKIRSRGECDPSRRRRNGRAMFGQLQRERESRGVKEGAAKAGRDIPSTTLNPSSSQHILQPDTFAHLFVQVLYHS